MLEILVTFEEFQLVFNFMLFFTLTLFFSIQEKYKVAKIWGGCRPPSHPGFWAYYRIRIFTI